MTGPRVFLVASRQPGLQRAILSGEIVLDFATRSVWTDEGAVRLRPGEFLLFTTLCARAPAPVTKAELADLLWIDDPDGGPCGAEAVAQQWVCHARIRLRELGISIPCRYGFGYTAGLVSAARVAV
jgi:DNA-binding response OmpR family regulator